ncbi:MAG: DUF3616 domain-containing protein [Rhodocyclaceae bacterium]
MNKIGTTLLNFDPKLNRLAKDKEIRQGLSVVLQTGKCLWLANDETISLERLSLQPQAPDESPQFGGHLQFNLADYLKLAAPPGSDPMEIEEADIEGLAASDGYLWLVGSHSLKRAKPKAADPAKKGAKRLAKIANDGNRFLLARIPVVDRAEGQTLAKEENNAGRTRTAALLRGDATGNELTRALAEDAHLKPFLSVPGKDNGFDIEGLAVIGERILLGLRGPVLRGWAIVLEVQPEDTGDPAALSLAPIGSDKQRYRKYFLRLDGLGIRDLCVQGDDLLILAGPTMDLDGPVKVFRWVGGRNPADEGLVPEETICLVGEIPFGQGAEKRFDHAEGMCLFADAAGGTSALLVVYDSAAPGRFRHGQGTVTADIFAFS